MNAYLLGLLGGITGGIVVLLGSLWIIDWFSGLL